MSSTRTKKKQQQQQQQQTNKQTNKKYVLIDLIRFVCKFTNSNHVKLT